MDSKDSLKENLKKQINGELKIPIAELIGFKLISYEFGKATFIMSADSKHHNPMGTIHGGIYCDIADAAMGVAFASTLEPNEAFGTISFQINFLRSLRKANLRAEGYLIKKGKSIGFLEAKIYDDENDLVATAQSTCKITRK